MTGYFACSIARRTRNGPHCRINVSVLVFEEPQASQALVVHLAHDITANRTRLSKLDTHNRLEAVTHALRRRLI